MKISILKLLSRVLLVCLLFGLIGYGALGIYYGKFYALGTQINGVYCTGYTVQEANSLLRETNGEYTLSLIDSSGSIKTINGTDIEYTTDYARMLKQIKLEQNPFLWGGYMKEPLPAYSIHPEGYFNQDKLKIAIENLNFERIEEKNRQVQVEIQKDSIGYSLLDETADVVNSGKLETVILKALEENQESISLKEAGCYEAYEYTKEQQETLQRWNKIDRVQSTVITYEADGCIKKLEKEQIGSFIIADKTTQLPLIDKEGNISLDTKKIYEYTKILSEEFNTKGRGRLWNKTAGGTVLVSDSSYGVEVDRKAEAESIEKALFSGISEVRKPVYKDSPAARGEEEIGDTYIEIDMTEQTLYYYLEGKLYLSTSVVTGNMSRKYNTPAKICQVYAKQRNRTLRGANYRAFVNYWIPVYGNIGLHDATWRSSFGGDIYKTSGSHGCINLPKEKAAELYDIVTVGTPVIMYY